ncbi:MAG: hypothetical protein KBD76_07115 [Bacteriovorax sp.]|nr:hypothetical protein [Bacteriovorax sp.]
MAIRNCKNSFLFFLILPLIFTSNAFPKDPNDSCESALQVYIDINKRLLKSNTDELRENFRKIFSKNGTLKKKLYLATQYYIRYLVEHHVSSDKIPLVDHYLKNIIYPKVGALGDSFFSPENGVVIYNSACKNSIGDFLTQIHEITHLIQWSNAIEINPQDNFSEKSRLQMETGAMLAEFNFLRALPQEVLLDLRWDVFRNGSIYGSIQPLIFAELTYSNNLNEFSRNYKSRSEYSLNQIQIIYEEKWRREDPNTTSPQAPFNLAQQKNILKEHQNTFLSNQPRRRILDYILFWR